MSCFDQREPEPSITRVLLRQSNQDALIDAGRDSQRPIRAAAFPGATDYDHARLVSEQAPNGVGVQFESFRDVGDGHALLINLNLRTH